MEPKDRLREFEGIPALSNCAVQLLGALRDDNSAAELEDIIRADEGVSAAVLRMANSVAMGGHARTYSLRESIARLGRQNLQRIAISLQASKVVADRGDGYGLGPGDLWSGSVAGALVGQWLAEATGRFDPGLTYVAALLRDVGKVAMEVLFGGDTLRDAFAQAGDEEPHLEVERRTLGIDHAELGAELATVWRLPEEIVDAIRNHHFATPDHGALAMLVHGADAICLQMGHGVGVDGLRYQRDPEILRGLGVGRPMVEQCMVEVNAELERVMAELSVAEHGVSR